MDRNIIAINHFYADQEEAVAHKCYAAARAAGQSEKQADRCDDGSLGCGECPISSNAQVSQ